MKFIYIEAVLSNSNKDGYPCCSHHHDAAEEMPGIAVVFVTGLQGRRHEAVLPISHQMNESTKGAVPEVEVRGILVTDALAVSEVLDFLILAGLIEAFCEGFAYLDSFLCRHAA